MLDSMASDHNTSSGRGLPRLRTTGQIGVRVDVHTIYGLLPEVVDEPWRANNTGISFSAPSLRVRNVLPSSDKPPYMCIANLFGQELSSSP